MTTTQKLRPRSASRKSWGNKAFCPADSESIFTDIVLERDFPEMAIWLPVGYQDDEDMSDGAQPLIPSFKSHIELARITQRMLDQLYSAHHSNLGAARRRTLIDSVNVDLCRWEDSLREAIKWNKWRPANEKLVPTVAALQ